MHPTLCRHARSLTAPGRGHLFDPRDPDAGDVGILFVKLNPATLMKNPVIFVVEVGAALTTIFSCAMSLAGAAGIGFSLQIALWLWFTVLFANFAEAMAEARGKAQADTLRKGRTEAMAKRLVSGNRVERFRPQR